MNGAGIVFADTTVTELGLYGFVQQKTGTETNTQRRNTLTAPQRIWFKMGSLRLAWLTKPTPS
jgi:hypothetical protein